MIQCAAYDLSLREAINSRDEYYIKSVIRPKIESCDYCVCMVGENTWRSRKWVPWELRIAAAERKIIYAMRFKDMTTVITPSVLDELGVKPFNWDVNRLFLMVG